MIVPQGSTWIIKNSAQFDKIIEIIVEDGGKIEIEDDRSLILTGASYITVLRGGKIKGDGDIKITNGSGGCKNYNAGTIDCSTLDFNGGVGEFYNYGELELEEYKASTNGMTLVNHGTIEAEDIEGNNNTNIKNGCYINVEEKFQFGTLVMGYSSEAICEEMPSNGNNNDIVMAAQSMLTCTKKASLYRNIKRTYKWDSLVKNKQNRQY